MKYETHSEYNPRRVAQTESAFLTVWAGLGTYHDDLVLVGGLVPKYLCRDVKQSGALPRPATLDVDLGISLGASAGQYGSLNLDLQAQGFRQDKEFRTRFCRDIEGFTVAIDFITEHPPAAQGSVAVDDIHANILPGINRALQTARITVVSGTDLTGAQQSLRVRVCEVGPFLVMKLRAFRRRQTTKDAFDILYTLLHYDRGTKAALTSFAEEARASNPAFPEALACLQADFTNEQSPGPVKAAHFALGPAVPSEGEDLRFQRNRIQQDMVDAARLLKAALQEPPPG